MAQRLRRAFFALKNSAPEEWRDKHQVEHDTPLNSPLAVLAQQLAGTALRPREPEDGLTETGVS